MQEISPSPSPSHFGPLDSDLGIYRPQELQLRAGQSLEALVRCGQAAQPGSPATKRKRYSVEHPAHHTDMDKNALIWVQREEFEVTNLFWSIFCLCVCGGVFSFNVFQ